MCNSKIMFAQKFSQSFYFVTSSISHDVVNYFPGPWGMGTSDAIFVCSG